MSYRLNKTDGTLLTDLIDGQIDKESTNLVLVGRNYSGFGEFLNENFIKLLENFSGTAAPSNPLAGQLWWDTAEQRVKVYDGTVWKASGGPFVQNTRPQMVAGDLWIDNLNNQFYFYDGVDTVLVGPGYTETQGVSGFKIENILDEQSRSRTVANLYVSGTLVAVVSDREFVPVFSQRVTGLVTDANPDGIIYKGINVLDTVAFKFHGTATASNALVTEGGVVRTAGQFLPSDGDGVTTGTLTIQNSGGLTIGLSQNNVQKVVGTSFLIENQLRDNDMSLRIRSTAFGSLITDAVYIEAETARVGIFNDNPQAMLHIGGDSNPAGLAKDVIIEGNLIVRGETTSISVNTLEVNDKNFELNKDEDGNTTDNAGATGGGMTLKSTDGDKTLNWITATNAWTSNVNVDLTSGNAYHVNGASVLSATTVGTGVVNSNIENLGILTNARLGQAGGGTWGMRLHYDSNRATVESTIGDLYITSAGNIKVNSKTIESVADPVFPQDVATKNYVDTQIQSQPIVFALDISGLGSNENTINNAIEGILTSMIQSRGYSKEENTEAYIHCTNIAASTANNIDVDAVKNISYVAVDSNGTQNESVVQDIAFLPASGTVSVAVARSLRYFKVVLGQWEWQSTTPL
jgi:hypothetical protein